MRKTVGANVTHYLIDELNPTGLVSRPPRDSYPQFSGWALARQAVAQVIGEYTGSPSPTTLVKTYSYGHDLLSQRTAAGTVHFYGYDGQGSVRKLYNSSGTQTDTYVYDAWGKLVTADSTTPTANHYRYTGEQWDADLGMYYLRARYYRAENGRFWTMDSYEGSQSDPLSLHKYLYAHASPVNGWDPSGNNFVQSLGALYGSAQLAALKFLTVAGSYGTAELTLGIMALGYAENINQGSYLAAGIALGIDAVSFGQGGQILRFPAWTKLSELKNWARTLHVEHVADAPASRKAMAASLQFAEEIAPGSIRVGGAGAQGADIAAEALVNGVSLTLKREVSVFQGDLTKNAGKALYDKILDEAAQTSGAQIRQVFIQITDSVTSAPNWRQVVAEKVQNARNFLGEVTIFVVDSDGRPVLP